MAKYFTAYEFYKSDTARKLNIDNIPNEDEMDNIITTMRMMDKIRERWTEYCKENNLSKPQILINSGFRCEALNNAVGGSKTSYHRYGSAADFEANNGQNKALFEVVLTMIEDGEITVSQLIWEKGNDNNPDWIHIAVYDGKKKNEILKYEKGKGYRKYSN
jgi:hypothetical protein